MVKEFGLRFTPTDLPRTKELYETKFIPSKLFFTKYRGTSNSELTNQNPSQATELDSGIGEDDIPRNYVRPIRKKSLKPHHVSELYAGRHEARVVVVALQAVELGDQTFLTSLSVRDLEGAHLLHLPAIVPRDFYSEAPGAGEECGACRGPGGKAVLHAASMDVDVVCLTASAYFGKVETTQDVPFAFGMHLDLKQSCVQAKLTKK